MNMWSGEEDEQVMKFNQMILIVIKFNNNLLFDQCQIKTRINWNSPEHVYEGIG